MELEGNEIELVEEMKILGVVISSDMRFKRKTQYMLKRAYSRIWILKRLYNLGASHSQMLDIYKKQIRSVLELAVPAWHPSLTLEERNSIERIQKTALHIIYQDNYQSYAAACEMASISTLVERRIKLCSKFALRALKNEIFSYLFKRNETSSRTRFKKPMFQPVLSRTSRYDNSPISYLTQLLNNKFKSE